MNFMGLLADSLRKSAKTQTHIYTREKIPSQTLMYKTVTEVWLGLPKNKKNC